MTQQKSERRVVPQGRRKPVATREVEPRGGGKAASVNEQAWQLGLPLGTAENPSPQGRGTDGGAAKGPPFAAPYAAPKPRVKEKRSTSVTMEAVCDRLEFAFQRVAANKGAPGPDQQAIEEVREHLPRILPVLRASLLEGAYAPGDIRRVWIPKAGGGQRGLGIPNVVDRMVQEAVRQVLEPLYEPTFHPSSHGFRPERSCHTALAEAMTYLEDGYEWVVDLDLKNFFDRVCHQRLMARLAQRVQDRRVLVVIGRMLKAKVVMPDGVRVSTEEGVPQGGPLSPLLSNIVLDELDRELSERGHRFVRYADDCNIYVRSERAGRRVMESVVTFIEGRMRLEVNRAKSAVARPENRHFLGFSLLRKPEDGEVEVLLSRRSLERLDSRIRELTPRTWGNRLERCIQELNVYLKGWFGFFCICTQGTLATLRIRDAHIRRRLRAIKVKHWKTKRTLARKLIALGVAPKLATRSVYLSRKGTWGQSRSPGIHRGLRNAYFAERGLVELADQWRTRHRAIVAPAQLTLRLG